MKKLNSFLIDLGIFSFITATILCGMRLLNFYVGLNVIDFFLGIFYCCALIIFVQTKFIK